MRTITISDAAYTKLLSQKIGRESISTTIIRLAELSVVAAESGWDAEKLDTDLNKSLKKSKKLSSHEEAFQ